MHPIVTDPAELRRWIGRRVIHDGKSCIVIEVLDDGPALVLGATGSDRVIQGNQFGDGHRRVTPTHTIPVYSADGLSLNPDYTCLVFEPGPGEERP